MSNTTEMLDPNPFPFAGCAEYPEPRALSLAPLLWAFALMASIALAKCSADAYHADQERKQKILGARARHEEKIRAIAAQTKANRKLMGLED